MGSKGDEETKRLRDEETERLRDLSPYNFEISVVKKSIIRTITKEHKGAKSNQTTFSTP